MGEEKKDKNYGIAKDSNLSEEEWKEVRLASEKDDSEELE